MAPVEMAATGMEYDSAALQAMLDQGNYATLALNGDPQDWRTLAALGLIGRGDKAIPTLQEFDHPQARFYLAVTHWIHGNEAEAVALLQNLAGEHAHNLLALILQPRIRVLTQLAATRQGPQNLLGGILKDPKFEVYNLSFHPDDLQNRPRASIHEYYDAVRPHFYACQMVEWHILPPDITELPCPIVGQASDYDLYLQTVYPWLHVFDEMVINDEYEWNDMRKLVTVPVSTFPKCFGIINESEMPSLSLGRRREIGVLATGSVLHPYFPEKTELFHELLAERELKGFFVNGFVENYLELITRSKVLYSFVIHRGGLVTKGLDALSVGCGLVVQRGSTMNLFLSEEDGVLTYNAPDHDLAAAAHRIVSGWPDFESRVRRGSARAREQYAMPRVASEYFRFLTFLAARPRGERKRIAPSDLQQKRLVLYKGWLPPSSSLHDITVENVRGWSACLASISRPHTVIDLTREIALWYADRVRDGRADRYRDLLDELFTVFRWGMRRFPRCLVLRFNYVRTCCHFGAPVQVSQGLAVLHETLAQPAESWEVGALEDVFPWDVFTCFFNYRRYLNHVRKQIQEEGDMRPVLRDTILASLYYYAAHYSHDIALLKAAMALDAEFPYYQLRYAQRAIDIEDARAQALQILEHLIFHSMLFVEASATLDLALKRSPHLRGEFEHARQYVRRARRSTLFLQPIMFRTLQPSAPSDTRPNSPPSSPTLAFPLFSSITTRPEHIAAGEEAPAPRGLVRRTAQQLQAVLNRWAVKSLIALFGVRRGNTLYSHYKQRKRGTGLS